MRAAYYGGTALTGSGQSVGLFEFSSYNENDVTYYFRQVGPTSTVPINGVSTDGSSVSCTPDNCGDDEAEVALDIEEAISMAPGLSQVLVYVAQTSDYDIFNKMATDNIAMSLSCSWGWEPADTSSDDPIFIEFAAQGQSLFVASGDNGAYSQMLPGSNGPFVYPAEDAYVTSVGGTDLTTTGPGGAWESEIALSYFDSDKKVPTRVAAGFLRTIFRSPPGSRRRRLSPLEHRRAIATSRTLPQKRTSTITSATAAMAAATARDNTVITTGAERVSRRPDGPATWRW